MPNHEHVKSALAATQSHQETYLKKSWKTLIRSFGQFHDLANTYIFTHEYAKTTDS